MRPILPLAHLLLALFRSRRGATAVEYGMIVALVVLAMFVGLRGLADMTIGLWTYVTAEVLAKS